MAEKSGWKGRLVRVAGYVLFVAVIYGVGVLWLFPYPELGRYLEARARPLGVELGIEGLRSGWLPGVKARRMRLASTREPATALELQDVRVTIPPTRWLRGDPAVEVQARTLGGTVDALYRVQDPPRVEARWEGISLAEVPRSPAFAELPLAGSSTGVLDAEVDPKQGPERLTGQVEATIQRAGLGPGKAQGFPVPEIDLGNGTFKISAQAGKVEVETAEFDGGDLGIDFKGNVLLRQDLPRSLINGVLSLRPNEKAAQELALVFAMFPGSRASDGRYTGRLRGTLGEPRLLKR